jgi:protocatechuate 3,4-dioxygenase beta subunit
MLKLGFALGALFLPLAIFSTQAQPSRPDRGTAIVSGVVTLKGNPSGGVNVHLLDQRPHSGNRYRITTDENGRFHIARVAAGKYLIRAGAPGYVSPVNDTTRISGQLLDVDEGAKIENIAIEIQRGGSITGRITDSSGKPVTDQEVNIHVYDNDGKVQRFSYMGGYSYLTDDRGIYRIYGLPKGRYLISVGDENPSLIHPFRPRTFYPNATGESKAKVIEVIEGSETTGIDITLPDPEQRSIKRGRTGENTLRLVTEDGVGLPYVKIDMIRVAEDGQSLSGGGFLDITDENGDFKFHENRPKNEPRFYWIKVSNAKGYAPKHPVNQHIGNDITVAMVKGGVITGRITNAKGEPVVGVSLRMLMVRDTEGKPIRGGVELHRITDDRGVYRYWGLTPGSYVLFTDNNIAGPFARYNEYVPIYHPLSTRETATEVIVKSGGETSGIDIHHNK